MTIIDYRYDECGLDNVVLKDLPVLLDDEGNASVTIPHVNALHRLLTSMVATKPSGLQPREIRFLRTEMELTQAQLAALVGKDVQTIGRWERGETPIERSAEIVIRARVLQANGTEALPPMEKLSEWTLASPSMPPFMIDASNPADYQPIAA